MPALCIGASCKLPPQLSAVVDRLTACVATATAHPRGEATGGYKPRPRLPCGAQGPGGAAVRQLRAPVLAGARRRRCAAPHGPVWMPQPGGRRCGALRRDAGPAAAAAAARAPRPVPGSSQARQLARSVSFLPKRLYGRSGAPRNSTHSSMARRPRSSAAPPNPALPHPPRSPARRPGGRGTGGTAPPGAPQPGWLYLPIEAAPARAGAPAAAAGRQRLRRAAAGGGGEQGAGEAGGQGVRPAACERRGPGVLLLLLLLGGGSVALCGDSAGRLRRARAGGWPWGGARCPAGLGGRQRNSRLLHVCCAHASSGAGACWVGVWLAASPLARAAAGPAACPAAAHGLPAAHARLQEVRLHSATLRMLDLENCSQLKEVALPSSGPGHQVGRPSVARCARFALAAGSRPSRCARGARQRALCPGWPGRQSLGALWLTLADERGPTRAVPSLRRLARS